jgi:DNA polymerase-3 subunit beta
MKFTINQKEIKPMLALSAKASIKKSTIPILSNILLDAKDGDLTIQATDLDMTFRATVPGDIRENGKLTVNAKVFQQICAVADNEIECSAEPSHSESPSYGQLLIRSGRSRWSIETAPAEQFPEKPKNPHKNQSTVPLKTLSKAIKMVAFAITQEQSRFTLSGANTILKDNKLTMVTTDGHRLAFLETNGCEVPEKFPIEALIPKNALLFLQSLPKSTERIFVSEGDHNIFFCADGCELAVRKLTGNFPDWSKVIPDDKTHPFSFNFDLVALERAIKRLMPLYAHYGGLRNIRMRWTIDNSGVSRIWTEGFRDYGSFETELVTSGYEGDELTFGFNPEYLMDLCKNVSSGVCKATVGVHGNLQVMMEPRIDETYKYVVMPLRG